MRFDRGWRWVVAVVLAVMFCSSGWGNRRRFESEDVPKAVPDLGRAISSIEVWGMESFLVDVKVTVTIEHPVAGDLHGYLISPSSTIVPLFTNVGLGSGANFSGTGFSDDAEFYIGDGSAPFSVTFRPEGYLGNFVGENPNGVWRLRINDTLRNDGGSVTGWELELTSGWVMSRTQSGIAEQVERGRRPEGSGPLLAYEHYVASEGTGLSIFDAESEGYVHFSANGSADAAPAIDGQRSAFMTVYPGESDWEIAVHDAATNSQTRVTSDESGADWPDISGSYVAWASSGAGEQIHLYDIDTDLTQILTNNARMKGDVHVRGPIVTWRSMESDGSVTDLMVYDITTGVTANVTNGGFGNVMGCDPGGRYVAFYAQLVAGDMRVYVYDVVTGTLTQITSGTNVEDAYMAGRYVAFNEHDGTDWEVWLYDIVRSELIRVTDNDTLDALRDAEPGWVAWETPAGPGSQVLLYNIEERLIEFNSRGTVDDFIPVLFGGSMAWFRGNPMETHNDIQVLLPVVCTERMPGDINVDCEVNFFDFALMAADWLRCERWAGPSCW